MSRCLQKTLLVLAIALVSEPALATQAHSAPEGLYAHQLAHIFFIVSMGVLIYWLRERKLVQAVGWRYIQYAALFFILWNLDAFSVPAVFFLYFGLRRLLKETDDKTPGVMPS